MTEWRPIETAGTGYDEKGFPKRIILGFVEDETGETLPSTEGFWRSKTQEHGVIYESGWVSSIDPDVPKPYLQPTHWMPLPEPPELDA